MSTTAEKPKANGVEHTEKGPNFHVHNIYVKDMSFESPKVPGIFNEEWNPHVDFDLQLNSSVLSEPEGIYEVVLHLTVTVTIKEDKKSAQEGKVAFIIDVKQAGIFGLHGFEPEVLKQVLGITCPTVVFPYARETVSNIVQKGGFPQLILPTLNFEAMYAHQQSNAQQSA